LLLLLLLLLMWIGSSFWSCCAGKKAEAGSNLSLDRCQNTGMTPLLAALQSVNDVLKKARSTSRLVDDCLLFAAPKWTGA